MGPRPASQRFVVPSTRTSRRQGAAAAARERGNSNIHSNPLRELSQVLYNTQQQASASDTERERESIASPRRRHLEWRLDYYTIHNTKERKRERRRDETPYCPPPPPPLVFFERERARARCTYIRFHAAAASRACASLLSTRRAACTCAIILLDSTVQPPPRAIYIYIYTYNTLLSHGRADY